MKAANNVIERAVTLTELDMKLYEELQGWGLFFSCSISIDDLSKNDYVCGILRMNDGMYSGCTVFRREKSNAFLMYMELIPGIRGKGLGARLFKQSAALLKDSGVTEILVGDPLDDEKASYLYRLGFTADAVSVYMEYTYDMLMNSLLHSKLPALASLISYTVSGDEVSSELKAAFINELDKKGERICESLILGGSSLFFLDKKGKIQGYWGIFVKDDHQIQVFDQKYLRPKVKGVDIRLILLGKLLEVIEQSSINKETFTLLFMTDDSEIEKGLEISIGLPKFKKDVAVYGYNLL